MKVYFMKDKYGGVAKGRIILVDYDHPKNEYSPAWSNVWVIGTPTLPSKRVQFPCSVKRDLKEITNELPSIPDYLWPHVNKRIVNIYYPKTQLFTEYFKRKYKKNVYF